MDDGWRQVRLIDEFSQLVLNVVQVRLVRIYRFVLVRGSHCMASPGAGNARDLSVEVHVSLDLYRAYIQKRPAEQQDGCSCRQRGHAGNGGHVEDITITSKYLGRRQQSVQRYDQQSLHVVDIPRRSPCLSRRSQPRKHAAKKSHHRASGRGAMGG